VLRYRWFRKNELRAEVLVITALPVTNAVPKPQNGTSQYCDYPGDEEIFPSPTKKNSGTKLSFDG
jgi:hypothetical protein